MNASPTNGATKVGKGLAAFVKNGGIGAWLIVLISVLAVLMSVGSALVYIVPGARADPYTGSMAREAWAHQQETNLALSKSLEALNSRMDRHESSPYHAGSSRELAQIAQSLVDILRRLDRIEAKVDGR